MPDEIRRTDRSTRRTPPTNWCSSTRWASTRSRRTSFSYIKAAAGSCKLASLTNVPCNTTGLEGAQISAGVAYYLDPSAYVFGLFTKVKNGTSAQYNNLALQKPNPGEDITSGAI